MIVIRGNNVFPSALEAIFRQFEEIAEFQIHMIDVGALSQVRIVIEPAQGAAADQLPQRVSRRLQDSLHFHAEVQVVAPGTLPRPEMKSRRIGPPVGSPPDSCGWGRMKAMRRTSCWRGRRF
jgi:phenylacetate-CoA ligase